MADLVMSEETDRGEQTAIEVIARWLCLRDGVDADQTVNMRGQHTGRSYQHPQWSSYRPEAMELLALVAPLVNASDA